MSFTDPLSVTISAVAHSCPRVDTQGDKTRYANSDGTIELSADHSETGGGRKRHVVRIDASKITTDPFRPSENVERSMSSYIVFDLPPAGYTATEAKAVFDGFMAMLNASSGAMITKLLQGES